MKVDQRGVLVRARILALLAEKPRTAAELGAELHKSRATVWRHLTVLMADPRQIRVCGHRPPESTGRWPELLGMGNAKDKAPPGSEPRTLRYKKERKNTESLDRYNARRRAKAAIARATTRGAHNPFSALGL